MAALEPGKAPRKQSEPRKRLSARGVRIEALLGGIQFDGFDIEETRRFGNALLVARDLWADRNRHGLRYSDREAARLNNRLARAKGGAR